MHRRFGFCATMLALAALSGPARAAPPFVEISAALAAGNGAAVLALADTGLREPNISSADRARLLMDRGFADQLLAQADNALTDLTQAIEIHGMTDLEQSRAYMERGIVLDGMGRIDDAIGDYSAVLRLDPSSLTALSNRARAYWRANHFEEARQDFLASLAANNPAPEYPYYGLGQVAESEGKPRGVRRTFMPRLSRPIRITARRPTGWRRWAHPPTSKPRSRRRPEKWLPRQRRLHLRPQRQRQRHRRPRPKA